MGYANFLPTALVGPPLEYNDYKDFMEGKGAYSNNSYSVLKIVGITFGETIFFLVLYVIYEMYASVTYMRTD